MSFVTIERVEPAPASKLPAMGVRVTTRAMKGRGGAGVGFIRIAISADLASAAAFQKEEQQVRLMLGMDNDTGKICVMVDQAGDFVARGKPGKNYTIAIGRRSSKGLFADSFEPFERSNCEVIKPANGQPRHFVFLATAAMLAADD